MRSGTQNKVQDVYVTHVLNDPFIVLTHLPGMSLDSLRCNIPIMEVIVITMHERFCIYYNNCRARIFRHLSGHLAVSFFRCVLHQT